MQILLRIIGFTIIAVLLAVSVGPWPIRYHGNTVASNPAGVGSIAALVYFHGVIDIANTTWLIAKRLIIWSGASILLGVGMGLTSWPFLQGIGLQMIVWGAIDLGIALFGIVRAKRLYDAPPEEHLVVQEALRLRRILIVNARLDILYVLAGATILVIFRHDPFLLGNGIGVLVQGVFLLIFDGVHAARLPDRAPTWYDGGA